MAFLAVEFNFYGKSDEWVVKELAVANCQTKRVSLCLWLGRIFTPSYENEILNLNVEIIGTRAMSCIQAQNFPEGSRIIRHCNLLFRSGENSLYQ
jgi:hypothetical protein